MASRRRKRPGQEGFFRFSPLLHRGWNMDGEYGATVASTAAASPPPPLPPPPPNHSESSPVAVPDEARALPSDKEHDYDPDEEPDLGGQPMEPVVQTEDLKHRIIKQVEYYFSDENLPTDKNMINLIRKNKEGFVPISIIASFRKMKKLTGDHSIIVAALRESSFLVVSLDGKKVKRLNPLPFKEVKDPKFCTVLAENLPEEHSMENMQKLFGGAGKVRNICIQDPHAMEERKKGSKSDILISSKLHALVEYETVEAAEKAVATLNKEQDWRNGMRVKLLKQIGKYGQRKQSRRESDSAKSSTDHASNQIVDEENHNSSEHHNDTPDEEEGEHASKEKNGQGGQNRRLRRGKYRPHYGMGHGSTSFAHAIEPSKPPPGPKMPDGTRGFTMGRGQPPMPNQSQQMI